MITVAGEAKAPTVSAGLVAHPLPQAPPTGGEHTPPGTLLSIPGPFIRSERQAMSSRRDDPLEIERDGPRGDSVLSSNAPVRSESGADGVRPSPRIADEELSSRPSFNSVSGADDVRPTEPANGGGGVTGLSTPMPPMALNPVLFPADVPPIASAVPHGVTCAIPSAAATPATAFIPPRVLGMAAGSGAAGRSPAEGTGTVLRSTVAKPDHGSADHTSGSWGAHT